MYIKKYKTPPGTQEVYTRKHLARRRKKNKEILKIKHKRGFKNHCPKKKNIEEKRYKHLQLLLAVLKTPIIYFPPNTQQEARRHYLPHNSTLSATSNPPTSNSTTRLGFLEIISLKHVF